VGAALTGGGTVVDHGAGAVGFGADEIACVCQGGGADTGGAVAGAVCQGAGAAAVERAGIDNTTGGAGAAAGGGA